VWPGLGVARPVAPPGLLRHGADEDRSTLVDAGAIHVAATLIETRNQLRTLAVHEVVADRIRLFSEDWQRLARLTTNASKRHDCGLDAGRSGKRPAAVP